MENFYFTFGSNHTNPVTGESLENKYVKITAENFSSAREEMFKEYKSRWAFQYSEEAFKCQIEKYNLEEFKHITIIN